MILLETVSIGKIHFQKWYKSSIQGCCIASCYKSSCKDNYGGCSSFRNSSPDTHLCRVLGPSYKRSWLTFLVVCNAAIRLELNNTFICPNDIIKRLLVLELFPTSLHPFHSITFGNEGTVACLLGHPSQFMLGSFECANGHIQIWELFLHTL